MNFDDPVYALSLVVFLPALVAAFMTLLPKGSDDLVKLITFVTTVATLVLVAVFMLSPFDLADGGMQPELTFSKPWIPSFSIDYFMGVDGISLPLVVLTAFISLVSMVAAWSINKNVKGFCMLFLVLETGMLGVFLALDFFLFYVFWEVMLLPMYFLIGIWGGPRKEYAAIKFFLYTLFGSVLMLIAILMLYFNSDLTALDADTLAQLHLSEAAMQGVADATDGQMVHTFNLLALAKMGQGPGVDHVPLNLTFVSHTFF